jgi:hypothetical protein
MNSNKKVKKKKTGKKGEKSKIQRSKPRTEYNYYNDLHKICAVRDVAQGFPENRRWSGDRICEKRRRQLMDGIIQAEEKLCLPHRGIVVVHDRRPHHCGGPCPMSV